MNLTDSQKTTVGQWVSQGDSIANIQRQLADKFQASMTYMEVRFLVDDLNIIFEEPEPEPDLDVSDADSESEVVEPELVDATAGVVLDVDAIMLPGALVSGSVTFTDGVSLKWQLSAAGQLGLIPGADPEYRPNPEDIQDFQAQLEEVLRSKGY
jgi:hypothetical protein